MQHKKNTFCWLAFTALLLFACKPKQTISTITGYTQGTTFTVKFWQESNTIEVQALEAEVLKTLNTIDLTFSNYRPDSVIEMFNQSQALSTEFDDEVIALLTIAKEVYTKSDGCYDPTIKPLFSLWGFSDKQLSYPSDDEINETLAVIGFDKITLDNTAVTRSTTGTSIDFSAIGQGYSVAKVAAILEEHNISNYIVEIGGEMVIQGSKPDQSTWVVGIQQPIPADMQLSQKTISNVDGARFAIMTSGTYQHFYTKDGVQYSHVINPKTGKPVAHKTVAVTVIYPDPTYADAWSTALLCLGTEKGIKIANQHKIPALFFDTQQTEIKTTESTSFKNSKTWLIKNLN